MSPVRAEGFVDGPDAQPNLGFNSPPKLPQRLLYRLTPLTEACGGAAKGGSDDEL